MRPSGGASRRPVPRHPPGPSCTAPSILPSTLGPTSTTAPNHELSTESRQVKVGLHFATEKMKNPQPLNQQKGCESHRHVSAVSSLSPPYESLSSNSSSPATYFAAPRHHPYSG
jgi:hypothetical protein